MVGSVIDCNICDLLSVPSSDIVNVRYVSRGDSVTDNMGSSADDSFIDVITFDVLIQISIVIVTRTIICILVLGIEE